MEKQGSLRTPPLLPAPSRGLQSPVPSPPQVRPSPQELILPLRQPRAPQLLAPSQEPQSLALSRPTQWWQRPQLHQPLQSSQEPPRTPLMRPSREQASLLQAQSRTRRALSSLPVAALQRSQVPSQVLVPQVQSRAHPDQTPPLRQLRQARSQVLAPSQAAQPVPHPSQAPSRADARHAWPTTRSPQMRSAQRLAHAEDKLAQAICLGLVLPGPARVVLVRAVAQVDRAVHVQVALKAVAVSQAAHRAVAQSVRVAEVVHRQQ